MLNSCAHVTIKNHEFCGDQGEFGASCFNTLTSESRDILKPQWDKERIGQICEKAEVFADWKAVIEKLCHKSKACDYEKLENFFNNVDAVHEKALQ